MTSLKYRTFKQYSNKYCTCGGHNIKNSKSNKNHNSTKRKMAIQQTRKFKKEKE